MSRQPLITALALAGFMLTGCEKDANEDVNGPQDREQQVPIDPPVLPESEAARAPQATEQAAQQPMQQEGDEALDLEVLPAVTVIAIEFKCGAADVYFPTASAELDAADKAALDGVAACLKGTKRQEQVEITASTDPRGSERYNEELSRRRAEAVAQYLREQGVKESAFEIRARGEQGVVEGIPTLWPLQREATVEPKPPAVTP